MPNRVIGGWKPSLANENFEDFLKSSISQQIVATSQKLIDWRNFCSPVENQSDIGACSSNATVGLLEFLEIKQGLKFVDLSRLFQYYNARLEDGWQDQDSGSNISSNFKALNKYGVCTEQEYPYNPSKVFVRPSWSAYQQAFGHRLTQSYKLRSNLNKLHEDILTCMRSCHPVVFGIDVYQSFMNTKSIMPIPQDGEKKLGGHAMLIVGVDLNKEMYLVRNSWGTSWGDNGYFWMPFEVFNKASRYECWTATHVGDMGIDAITMELK